RVEPLRDIEPNVRHVAAAIPVGDLKAKRLRQAAPARRLQSLYLQSPLRPQTRAHRQETRTNSQQFQHEHTRLPSGVGLLACPSNLCYGTTSPNLSNAGRSPW